MAKVSLVKGTTSYLARIFIQDSSSTTGAGLSGLTSGSSGLICYRARDDDGNAGGTQITLSAGTRGTWSSGGFVEKDSTNMKGVYELGIPNNALVTGSNTVTIMLSGATNMAPLLLEFELTGWNNQDGVHGGMTAIPNAAAGASGGLIINGSNSGTCTLAALIVTGSLTISDGLLVSRSSSNASAATFTGNGTGSGIVATSGGGATGDGIQATSSATAGNGMTLTHAGTGKDFNATTTPLTLAKGTNLTGLNDIAATAIVSAGAITTNSGKVSEVALVDTLTTYTGNTPQTGDVYPLASSTGVVILAADRPGIRKNIALAKFEFLMTDSTNHNPVTGLTITATRSIDNGAFAAGTLSAITEIANGVYSVDFGAGDLNGGVITLQLVAAGADSLFITIVTTP